MPWSMAALRSWGVSRAETICCPSLMRFLVSAGSSPSRKFTLFPYFLHGLFMSRSK